MNGDEEGCDMPVVARAIAHLGFVPPCSSKLVGSGLAQGVTITARQE